MALSREQLLAAAAPRCEAVEVPGVGTLHVRSMTAGERMTFSAGYESIPRAEVPARIVALCACDESGARLFGDSAEDLAAIQGLDGVAVEHVCRAATRFNRLDGAEDDAKN